MKTENLPIVLVYEGEPQKKTSLYHLLENQQIDLMPCTSMQALEKVQFRHSPHVIVMDMSVDYADKLAAFRFIRSNPTFSNSELIVVKTEGQDFFHDPEKKSGIEFINSPIFHGELYGKLHKSLYQQYIKQA